MGRIVIETDDETGETTVDLTMSNGQRVKFASAYSSSEFRHVRPEPETIEFAELGGHVERIVGRVEPSYWRFTLTVDKVARIDAFEEEGST